MTTAKNHGQIIGPVALQFADGTFRGKGTWYWLHLASGLTFDLPLSATRSRQSYAKARALALKFAADDHSA